MQFRTRFRPSYHREPIEPPPHEVLEKKLDEIYALLQSIQNKLGISEGTVEKNDAE